MRIYDLKHSFEALEKSTVSDSFGGPALPGRAPDFRFVPILDALLPNIDHLDAAIRASVIKIGLRVDPKVLLSIVRAAGRFSFCIELTNLTITSTKMKTRWMPGKIIQTRPDSFQNFEGFFKPGDDPRSNTFDECLKVFSKCLDLIANSAGHLEIMKKLLVRSCSGIPYESVFDYSKIDLDLVHQSANIRLVNLQDVAWLIGARPILYKELNKRPDGSNSKVIEKIKTKSYKTDRSQTGEVQTNRAKRWECLNNDFQRASLEDCWSVERKLLSDLCGFEGFPGSVRQQLEMRGVEVPDNTICPITLAPLSFLEFLNGDAHGESKFQVGHMSPLKRGGAHNGDNIAWISGDGNRIQGSLTLADTHSLLKGIVDRLNENNPSNVLS